MVNPIMDHVQQPCKCIQFQRLVKNYGAFPVRLWIVEYCGLINLTRFISKYLQ